MKQTAKIQGCQEARGCGVAAASSWCLEEKACIGQTAACVKRGVSSHGFATQSSCFLFLAPLGLWYCVACQQELPQYIRQTYRALHVPPDSYLMMAFPSIAGNACGTCPCPLYHSAILAKEGCAKPVQYFAPFVILSVSGCLSAPMQSFVTHTQLGLLAMLFSCVWPTWPPCTFQLCIFHATYILHACLLYFPSCVAQPPAKPA